MIHLALFTWKPGTGEKQLRALCDGLATLPSLIPDIRSYRFGVDAGLAEGNDRFAVVAEFDDIDGYRRYATDARHRDVVERLLEPILATRHAVQLAEPAQLP